MDNDPKAKPRGFAGLADIAPPPPSLPPSRVERPISTSPPASARHSADSERPTPPPSGDTNKSAWVVAIFVGAGLVAYAASSKKQEDEPYPVPAYQSSLAPAPAPVAFASPAPPPAESMPPAADGLVFNDDQIRYCVAQKIRLGAWEQATQLVNGADVDRFNERVADYNARCGHYKYRRGAQERVVAEMEADRYTIESGARATWLASIPFDPQAALAAERARRFSAPLPSYLPVPPSQSTSNDED